MVWKASRWDGGKRRRFEDGAQLAGRLIAARIGQRKSKEWLYLFTTLSLPAWELVELYGRRWHIETDLRSLKRTVDLHHISAKSPDMLEKELLMAASAYNLVRAVMCLGGAAQPHRSASTQLRRGSQRGPVRLEQAASRTEQPRPRPGTPSRP